MLSRGRGPDAMLTKPSATICLQGRPWFDAAQLARLVRRSQHRRRPRSAPIADGGQPGSVPDRPVTASDPPPSQNLPRSMQSQSVPCRGADGQRAGHQHHRDRYAQDFGLKSQDRAGRVVHKSEFSVGRECLAPAGSSASHNDDPAGFNRVRAEEQEQRHDQRRSNEFSH